MTFNDQRKKTILANLSTRQFRYRRIWAFWCAITDHDWLHISVPHDPKMLDGERIVTLVCFRCSDCRVFDISGEDYRHGRSDPRWREKNRYPR